MDIDEQGGELTAEEVMDAGRYESEIENRYEVDKETQGIDSRDKMKHIESSDQFS